VHRVVGRRGAAQPMAPTDGKEDFAPNFLRGVGAGPSAGSAQAVSRTDGCGLPSDIKSSLAQLKAESAALSEVGSLLTRRLPGSASTAQPLFTGAARRGGSDASKQPVDLTWPPPPSASLSFAHDKNESATGMSTGGSPGATREARSLSSMHSSGDLPSEVSSMLAARHRRQQQDDDSMTSSHASAATHDASFLSAHALADNNHGRFANEAASAPIPRRDISQLRQMRSMVQRHRRDRDFIIANSPTSSPAGSGTASRYTLSRSALASMTAVLDASAHPKAPPVDSDSDED